MHLFIARGIRLLPILFSLLLIDEAASQKEGKIDSVLRILSTQKVEDELKVDHLNALSSLYYRLDLDSSYSYAHHALRLSKSLGYELGESESFNNLGFVHIPWGNYDSSRTYFKNSLSLQKNDDSSHLLSETYNGIGILNEESGRYALALEAYNRALKIKLDIGDLSGQGKIHNNLGQVFRNIGELDSAVFHLLLALENEDFLRDYNQGASTYLILGMVKLSLEVYEESKSYFQKALARLKFTDRTIQVATCNSGLGRIYLAQGDLDSAKFYLKKGSRQFKAKGHLGGIAHAAFSLGEVFRTEGNCDSALFYYSKGVDLKESVDNSQYLARYLTNMSRCLVSYNMLDSAIAQTLNAVGLARKYGSKVEAFGAYSLLHEIYSRKKEYQKAYEMMKLSAAYKDSVMSQQRINEINRLESQFEISAIEKEKELIEVETAAEELRLKWMLFTTIVGVATLIIISLILYFSLKQKRQDNKLIAKKNEKIKLINESLEQRVEERTMKVKQQNEKLRSYAFSNSHEVRAPLSRLMGLVNMWNKKNKTIEERDFLVENISKSAVELDDIVRKLNDQLKEEDLDTQ